MRCKVIKLVSPLDELILACQVMNNSSLWTVYERTVV